MENILREHCLTVVQACLHVQWATQGGGLALCSLVAFLANSHFAVSSDPSLQSLLTHHKQKGGRF